MASEIPSPIPQFWVNLMLTGIQSAMSEYLDKNEERLRGLEALAQSSFEIIQNIEVTIMSTLDNVNMLALKVASLEEKVTTLSNVIIQSNQIIIAEASQVDTLVTEFNNLKTAYAELTSKVDLTDSAIAQASNILDRAITNVDAAVSATVDNITKIGEIYTPVVDELPPPPPPVEEEVPAPVEEVPAPVEEPPAE